MFIRLALRSIKKNANRSRLAIVAMVAAAALMASGGIIADATPEGSYMGFRQAAGADILVTPFPMTLDEARLTDRATAWRLVPAPVSETSDLPGFSQQPAAGLIEPSGDVARYFSLDSLPTAVTTQPNTILYPYLALPAVVTYSDCGVKQHTLNVIIRGRLPQIDRDRYAMAAPDITLFGRYLNADDAGLSVAVGNFAAPPVRRMAGLLDLVGMDNVTVSVPRVGDAGDRLVYDYGNMRGYDFRMVGWFQIPTYRMPQEEPGGGTLKPRHDNDKIPFVQMYWDRPELFIPAETWQAIWRDATGGMTPRVDRVGLVVDGMFTAKDLAARITAASPGAAAVTVPDLAASGRSGGGQIVLPRQVTGVQNILMLALAALLVAGNMHVLVSQRRHELGMMRSIGVSSRDIFALILVETLGLSLLGSLAGFVLARAMVGMVYAAGRVSLAFAAKDTVASLVRVVGATVGVALVFGLFPALRAARSTTMEVLGNE